MADRSVTVAVAVAPAGDVIALDLWGDEDPRLYCGDISLFRVEPRRWWLLDAAHHVAGLTETLGDHGALAPIGGGLVRARLSGPGWRDLLMVAGLFDAEDPRLGAGAVAATMLHHVPVRIAVATETACDVYCAASYAPTLIELWSTAIGTEKVSLSLDLSATAIGAA